MTITVQLPEYPVTHTITGVTPYIGAGGRKLWVATGSNGDIMTRMALADVWHALNDKPAKRNPRIAYGARRSWQQIWVDRITAAIKTATVA